MDAPEVRRYRRQLLNLVQGLRRHKMIGVEVGVAVGATSALLLERFANLTLFMVDTWASFPEGCAYRETGDKRSRLTDEEQTNRMLAAEQAVAFAAERAFIIKLPSVSASQAFVHKADFVFIDGSHAYRDVRDDLDAWWPKLSPRGLFCGHDYSFNNTKFAGVKQAVDQFFESKKLLLNFSSETAIWWGYKP